MGGWPHERTETTVPGVPGEGGALKLGLCFPVWSMSWLEGLNEGGRLLGGLVGKSWKVGIAC